MATPGPFGPARSFPCRPDTPVHLGGFQSISRPQKRKQWLLHTPPRGCRLQGRAEPALASRRLQAQAGGERENWNLEHSRTGLREEGSRGSSLALCRALNAIPHQAFCVNEKWPQRSSQQATDTLLMMLPLSYTTASLTQVDEYQILHCAAGLGHLMAISVKQG